MNKKKSSNKKSPINLISDAILKYNNSCKTECCPIEGAGIQLEWDNKTRHLEIEVPEYFYVSYDSYEDKESSGTIKTGNKELVDNLFKWLNFEIDKI